MRNEIRACEEKSARLGGRGGSVLASRATTGLAAALSALGLEKGSGVVMPVAVCANVVYAVRGAGLTPIFVDVGLQERGIGIDPISARRSIEKSGNCRALLAIPLFGGEVDWVGLSGLAQQFGLAVIEDAAQVGLIRNAASTGQKSVCSIVSFGAGKIGSAGGGGAVLSDDGALLERVRSRLDRGMYDKRIPDMAVKVSRAMDGVEAEVEQRMRMAGEYRRRLGGMVEHVGEVLPVWKYSVLVEDRAERERLTHRLLEVGIEATNLYPPLTRWFMGVKGEDYTGARTLYERIINLPLWGEKHSEREENEWMELTLEAAGKSF